MASINGTANNDSIDGTQDGDAILALAGNDTVSGLAGNDSINGNQGFDTLSGGQGSDTIYGGRGNDSLRGGKGNDLLFGGDGNDTLWGDRGMDTLTGGSGADLFAIGTSQDTDTITDFGSNDLIGLTDSLTWQNLDILPGTDEFAGSAIVRDRITGKTLAVLSGIDPSTISSANFVSMGVPTSTNHSGTAANNFDIRFDYRYDTNGFFSDPARRAVLEATASYWEGIIKNDFPDIPVGTETPFVTNPQSGASDTFFTDTPIDDLLVFVGARELGGSTLAQSGPSGYFVGEDRYTGPKSEPWIGSITFDSLTNWFFDPTPATADDIPKNKNDFFETALHELAHVMGFGTTKAFDNLISGSVFTGVHAEAANNGKPVSLAPDLGHISDEIQINGLEPLMGPTVATGTRPLPTSLDLAMLVDIGYII